MTWWASTIATVLGIDGQLVGLLGATPVNPLTRYLLLP